jgi:hypothetical protein
MERRRIAMLSMTDVAGCGLTVRSRMTAVRILVVLVAGSVLLAVGAFAQVAPREESMPPTRPPTATAPAQSATRGAGIELPASVDVWARGRAPRRIAAGELFDYMDGAGELYLAYRFDHLDVAEYTAGGGDDLLVELYQMRSSDDAFGLLSTDWGGQPADFEPAATSPDNGFTAGWPRALYGAGLLRVWSDNLYVRIMATRESEAAARAVFALARGIVQGRGTPAPPRLAAALPATVGAGFALRRDTVCFLRSHLVLNSAYFLAQENLLALGPDVDAVTARYDRVPQGAPQGATPVRVQVVLARYPDVKRASQAANGFRRTYLKSSQALSGTQGPAVSQVEGGVVGHERRGRCLAIALDCPDRAAAVSFVNEGLKALAAAGGCDE